MSFIKSIKCIICSRQESIEDVNFPEDLYDLITKYKIDQLFWFCVSCKNNYVQNHTLVVSAILNKPENAEVADVSLNDKYGDKRIDGISKQNTSSNGHQNDYKNDSLQNCFGKIDDTSSSPLCGITKEDKSGLKYVHEILNLIKIDPREAKNSQAIVQSILSALLTELKKNEEFACMFSRLFYTGSSYNDLRITSASEYDIDLVLKVPKNVKLIPEFYEQYYSFGKLKLEMMNDDNTSLPVKILKSKCKDVYLQPNMISSWLQSQIDSVLNQDFRPAGIYNIKSVKSGPARTIIVETDSPYAISIDIVPVFEFEYSVLCDTSIFPELQKTNDKNKDKWFMVPKECQGEIDVLYSDNASYWRSVYPNAEKEVLSGKECAKSVIKILKMFRDKKGWKGLASYYLNMVVILEVIKNPDAEFWKNGNLFQRLMEAFQQLENYLRERHLPHFLTKQNLLHKFDEDHCNNWYNHLKRSITSLKSNPDQLVELLKRKEVEDRIHS